MDILSAFRRADATGRAQHGVITTTQLLGCGLTRKQIRRLVGSGKLIRLYPNVYRVVGAPVTWQQKLSAACLWAGIGSAASYQSAAGLWALKGFGRGRLEISTTRRVRLPKPTPIAVHRVSRLLPGEIATKEGIPVTSLPRTLIDLSGVVASERVERALDDVLRRKLTTPEELRNYLRLEARQGRTGVIVFRSLLDVRQPGYVPQDSPLSHDLEMLVLASDLPRPVGQYPVFVEGRLVRVFDLAYPDVLLAVEADGWDPHSDRIEWSKDHARDNRMGALGWLTLRYTRYDIDERPGEVIEEIRSAIEARRGLFRDPKVPV